MANRYNEQTGLPKGGGFYWKCGVIYVTIWRHGDKRQFCCKGPDGRPTDKTDAALDFKKRTIKQLDADDEARLVRGVRVSELLDDYIAHLVRMEQDQGAYMLTFPKETPSYKTKNLIDCHLAIGPPRKEGEPWKCHSKAPFGHLKPDEITNDVLNDYRDARVAERKKNTPVSVVSINRELSVLRSALNRGAKATPRKVNPLHIPSVWPINVKAEKKAARTVFITREQFETILGVAADHLKPIVATVEFGGIRSKEIKFIRPCQINWDNNRIELRAGETKEGDSKIVPMNDFVKSILWEWHQATLAKYGHVEFFFHFEGKQIRSWKTSWHSALEKAGLRKQDRDGKWVNLVRFHDTRRSSATFDDEIGIDQADTAKKHGHHTSRMATQYNQSTQSTERVRLAQNKALKGNAVEPAPIAPVASVSDWKANLRELKAAFEEGLLPQDLYSAEVAKVMANR